MKTGRLTPPLCARAATSQNIPSQLERRRSAAHRLAPLECGCSDPWLCDCDGMDTLSDAALDGYREAALHILESGQTPMVPMDVRRGLWRRGGEDRALAEKLHSLAGGEVA